MLEPHSATITQAVDYYLRHVVAFRKAPTIREITDRMIAEARTNGRRERTIVELRQRLGRFADTFGDRQLTEVGLDEIQVWLNDPTWSAQTRRNYATKISQVYNYAIRQGWSETNLVKRIARPNGEEKEPGIFTVQEAEALLSHAKEHELLAFVCLGLFAGLRTNELLRLDWKAVRFQERSIIVGSDVAKKRSRRIVEISDTLAAWLVLCMHDKGPVVDPRNYVKRLRGLAKTSAVDWRNNGLRHSFGTYHLAMHGNEIETARQMGHRSADLVHNHYKALVPKKDAEKFWSLRPSAEDTKKLRLVA